MATDKFGHFLRFLCFFVRPGLMPFSACVPVMLTLAVENDAVTDEVCRTQKGLKMQLRVALCPVTKCTWRLDISKALVWGGILCFVGPGKTCP